MVASPFDSLNTRVVGTADNSLQTALPPHQISKTTTVRLQGLSRLKLRNESSSNDPRLSLVLGHGYVLEQSNLELQRQRQQNLDQRRRSNSQAYDVLSLRPVKPMPKSEQTAESGVSTRDFASEKMATVSIQKESGKDWAHTSVTTPSMDFSFDEFFDEDLTSVGTYELKSHGQADHIEFALIGPPSSDDSSSGSDSDDELSDHDDDKNEELPRFDWAYRP